MRCLIDADVLVYELAFSGQYKDEDTDETIIREFDFVADLLDQKIKEIEAECWADEPSILFLTNDEKLSKMWNRKRKTEGLDPVPYIPNFRIDLATVKPYKGQRKQEKPFHRDNIRAYMLDKYDVRVANGMEADDLLAIHQTQAEPLTTVICSRDKDLKMVEGMHFSWPCGKQLQWGPAPVSKLGELHYDEGKNKLTGTGCKFFYSQLITGDTVDNIPGLPRGGPSLAFKLLHDKESEGDMFRAVAERYELKFGDDWREAMLEQAQLLWMCTEMDGDKPKMWEMPDG
jgi:hypothetical protein